MRRWLWAVAAASTVFVSLAVILAILNAPRGLEAQPTRPITAALVGEPYTLGVENTAFRVQNGGLLPASVIVDYYDPSGLRVAHEKVDGLPAGASVGFDQAGQPDLPHGFAGSAVVTADQSVRTIILKRVEEGDALSLGADNGIASGASRVYLPVIYSRFGLDGAWNTRFALQNVSMATTACVQMTYRRHDGTVVFSEPVVGLVADLRCPNGGLPLPPQGVILRNQANMTAELPEQFEGSVIVETVSQDQRSAAPELLAVSADIFNSLRGSFASYKGLGWNPSGTGELSTTVLLPLMLKNFGEGASWNTRFAVSSADPSQLTSVTLTYCCDGRLPGPGGSFRKTFVMGASTIIDQGLELGLPDGFAGSAVITASQPLAVVEIMASALAEKPSFGAFAATPRSLAATTIWLPLVYKDFGWKGPLGVAAGWNSWFRVQVADGGSASVQVTYHGEGLAGGSISFSDTVTDSKTFDQHTDPLLPSEFQGSAVITSDRPIVVAAAITSDAYLGDADALFAGFGPDLFPSPGETASLSLVRGWNSACYRGPGQPVDSALGSVLNSVVALYRLRPDQQFDRWFAGRPEVSTITALNPYDSLLILMGSDASWQQQLSGSVPAHADLVPGWNGVCYAGPTQNVEAATASISGRFGVIYVLAADEGWKRFVPGRPEISNLSQLEQFNCVFILVTDPAGARWLFGP